MLSIDRLVLRLPAGFPVTETLAREVAAALADLAPGGSARHDRLEVRVRAGDLGTDIAAAIAGAVGAQLRNGGGPW